MASEVVDEVRAAAGSVIGDVASGRWRRAGLVGLSLGVVAAGAAAGVAIERLTVNRDMRRRAEREVDAASPYGTLHGPTWPVPAPDGTVLHAELDGTAWPGGRPPSPPREPAEDAVPDTPSAPALRAEAVGGDADPGGRALDAPSGPALRAEAGRGSRRVARGAKRNADGGDAGPGGARGVEGGDGRVVGGAPDEPSGPALRAEGGRASRGGARGGEGGDGRVAGRALDDPSGPALGAEGESGGGSRRTVGGAPEAQTGDGRGRPRRGLLARLRGAEGGGALGGVLAGGGSWLGMAHTPPLTVVFCHGYCLNEDCWHFQREAFRSGLRLVFWDQRSHGRSERSRSYLAGEAASIDQLGGDLKAVIDQLAPTGPLVLVGHSMGGMTVMALADQHPELFAERVAGVALLGTTAGGWSEVTLGLGGVGAKVFHRIGPGVLKVLGRQRALVERGRKLSSELTAAVYDMFSFGSDDVDPALARFARRSLEATPIDVVAEFFPVFPTHDKLAALPVLQDIPTLVMGGTADLLTPASHSEAIAEALPDAELEILPDTGHLLMLERPAEVNAALARLLRRAADRTGAPLPDYVNDLAQEGN